MALVDRPHPIALIYRLGFSPFVMKLFARYFYPLVTRRLGIADMVFLNDGYEEDPPMALPLAASDEPHRFPIQLYHRVANQVDLSGKRVLEVSCGHGGGASYLVRTMRPASYTGLDLNPAGVAFCRKTHVLPGLDFVQGNAEDLPFADQSMDAVINVEASHCYPRFDRFLAEVARVLRPGGHFLYTDLRPRLRIAEWEAALAKAPLRMVSQAEINAEVLRALMRNSERLLTLVSQRLPPILHGVGREAAHVQGSRYYRDLQRGEFSYRVYCFTKD
ncbi:phthiotriol/phenolphthiotriol dimycocerosates methyltransferase [Mycobacterium botniense]|uniref:Phthiotriol/phenolphthiotriol dimycocerosates methyltransferase n=2 Tax=Mycobacterium botniense TaxID=84962 RepID=A0A7I9Y2C3_9MYCO|nr:phthiotriol/phenolphthiotriol dimycocerosates methyltransferase [Mycobacterium botniense]